MFSMRVIMIKCPGHYNQDREYQYDIKQHMFICGDYQLLFMECPPYATMLCFFSSFEKYKIKYLLLASKKNTKNHDSCNATNPVSRHCMENAMYVLLYEANQVKNYFKQSMQFLRHSNFTFQSTCWQLWEETLVIQSVEKIRQPQKNLKYRNESLICK